MNSISTMQSAEEMLALLNDLVSYRSVTLSEEEKHFPLRVQQHLLKIPYFSENQSLIENHITTDGRIFLTALYKHPKAVKTVILLSHFDVVDVEDYGEWKHLAFRPLELTEALHSHKEALSPSARKDLESGEWLFGRGTMDMKCGLVQHISLLERASAEDWEINLILLTVPDEEVNSIGMREAIPKLLELAEQHDLHYSLTLNSEPMFSQKHDDENHYFYTGSIGKILPGALCFGKETHVGEPLSGVNAGWMTSCITNEFEWNEKLCETVDGVTSPPPTLLWQRDLKKEYSAQIPHRSVSLYNLFLMKRNPSNVMDRMIETAESAAFHMNRFIREKYNTFGLNTDTAPEVRVITYAEVRELAIHKTSAAYIASLEHSIAKERDGDNRAQAIRIIDQLSIICQDLAPMIVLFFAPPYYPAVCTDQDPIIEELSGFIQDYSTDKLGHTIEPVQYFNGISDLSYAILQASLTDMNRFQENLPGDQELYDIPFKEMAQLTAPVLNVGPVGRDAHKHTERLHIPYAFEQLPKMLSHIIQFHMKQ